MKKQLLTVLALVMTLVMFLSSYRPYRNVLPVHL